MRNDRYSNRHPPRVNRNYEEEDDYVLEQDPQDELVDVIAKTSSGFSTAQYNKSQTSC
jgi:hypothetical protein